MMIDQIMVYTMYIQVHIKCLVVSISNYSPLYLILLVPASPELYHCSYFRRQHIFRLIICVLHKFKKFLKYMIQKLEYSMIYCCSLANFNFCLNTHMYQEMVYHLKFASLIHYIRNMARHHFLASILLTFMLCFYFYFYLYLWKTSVFWIKSV